MESARGTIIRLTKLSDTSLIILWMSEEEGLLKTVAKGARRPKSAFAGRLDLFVDAGFQWSRSRSSDLHGLREVAVTDYREPLRGNYRDSVVAAYFGQLLEMVLELNHAEPEIFALLQRGLAYLTEEGGSRKAVLHFEKEVARLLGLGDGAQRGILNAYGKLPASREHCLDLFI
ncbi:DNA repair protein RecO [Akkermansiaceae bacterium]|nr:DNA repair protein RecO [Akkermansiaceae bacterium]MDB4576778.1 DNA repair protein RecO [Akkermansiaceae bacterium]MDB4792495.1 DNA repair protein RecO [bacterium]